MRSTRIAIYRACDEEEKKLNRGLYFRSVEVWMIVAPAAMIRQCKISGKSRRFSSIHLCSTGKSLQSTN